MQENLSTTNPILQLKARTWMIALSQQVSMTINMREKRQNFWIQNLKCKGSREVTQPTNPAHLPQAVNWRIKGKCKRRKRSKTDLRVSNKEVQISKRGTL